MIPAIPSSTALPAAISDVWRLFGFQRPVLCWSGGISHMPLLAGDLVSQVTVLAFNLVIAIYPKPQLR